MGITREQALDCFASDDLIGIGMEADAIRRGLHPEGVVSYSIEAVVAGPADVAALREALDGGATGVLVRGTGVQDAVTWLQREFPALPVGVMSAGAAAELEWLQERGVRSIGSDDPGLGGEWLARHRAAHGLRISTAAGMVFGQNETMEQRVDLLFALRQLQEETGGFASFTPSVFQHDVAAGGRSLEEATSVEYLKTLAICRMVLDNIPNVQANWRTQGTKTMQMALRFGANDVGSVALPSELAAGASEEDLRRIIRDAGFRPVQRDGVYRVMFLD